MVIELELGCIGTAATRRARLRKNCRDGFAPSIDRTRIGLLNTTFSASSVLTRAGVAFPDSRSLRRGCISAFLGRLKGRETQHSRRCRPVLSHAKAGPLVVPGHCAHLPAGRCENKLRGDHAATFERNAVQRTGLRIGDEAVRDVAEAL